MKSEICERRIEKLGLAKNGEQFIGLFYCLSIVLLPGD